MELTQNRHKRSATNIEKKIMKTTFITHANNLKTLYFGESQAIESPNRSKLWKSDSSDSYISSQYLSPHISAIKGMENF